MVVALRLVSCSADKSLRLQHVLRLYLELLYYNHLYNHLYNLVF